jgi:hypothetical protein
MVCTVLNVNPVNINHSVKRVKVLQYGVVSTAEHASIESMIIQLNAEPPWPRAAYVVDSYTR